MHTNEPAAPDSEAQPKTDRALVTPATGSEVQQTVAPTLTAREFQVAEMIAIGMTGREIADDLGISVKTYDTHRAHVLRKLELRNTVELARHALRKGWVTL